MGQGKTDEANATKETVRQINEKLSRSTDNTDQKAKYADAFYLCHLAQIHCKEA